MQVAVKTLDNGDAGTIELDDGIFGVEARKDILHRVVTWQLAKRRAGTHKAKGRSEITGTTAKIWKQKGTGRARHGSRKAPLFRGGGVAFGPQVRDHGYSLPKKVRRLGLKCALSAKQAAGELIVLESVSLAEAKTALLKGKLAELGLTDALIVGGSELDANFLRAARNLPGLHVLPSQGANVYDILRKPRVALTRDAVEQLKARLS